MPLFLTERISDLRERRAGADFIDSTARRTRVVAGIDAEIARLEAQLPTVVAMIETLKLRPDVDLANDAAVVLTLLASGFASADIEAHLDELIERARAHRQAVAMPEGV